MDQKQKKSALSAKRAFAVFFTALTVCLCLLFAVATPAGVSAQVGSGPVPGSTTTTTTTQQACATLFPAITNIPAVFDFLTCLIEQSIMPLLFMFAILAFIWGVIRFVIASDSTEKEQGQQFMLWGIIGLAVMFSIWGLVNLFGDTFHTINILPKVPVTNPSIV